MCVSERASPSHSNQPNEILNEHALYKRGVAWSFHGDNFCEKSGEVSGFVALLPLKRSMDTGKFHHHSQLFSGGFFMASKLVAK